MKYLCTVYVDEKKLMALSQAEANDLDIRSLAHDEALRKSGHLIMANALQFIDAATTIRVRNGKASLTDGPFAETNEQLGGFVVIEARDLNEAIQLASKIPSAEIGCVEVRPTRELTPANGVAQ